MSKRPCIKSISQLAAQVYRQFSRLSASGFPTPVFLQSRRGITFIENRLLKFCNRIARGPRRLYSTTGPGRPYSTSVAKPSFSFRIGAAFSGKITPFNPAKDCFSFDPSTDHNAINTRRQRSGQDAFFISKIGNGGNVAFGVADGVGGWIDSGIDSAHFSRGLCRYMAKVAREFDDSNTKIRAESLLQEGYEGTVDDKSIVGGGSTACVAVTSSDGHIEVANLGDSGFVQLRLNAIHHYSNPQTHAFNTPYQLSIIPPKLLARSRMFGGGPLMDLPSDASITNHQVRNGDVLVFATDGVWDNLSSLDVLKIVSRQMQDVQAWTASEKGLSVSDTLGKLTLEGSDHSLQARLAVAIAGEAKVASLNTRTDGPFAKQVQKFYPHENFHGGKVDDICVVVAIVVSA